MDTKFYVCHGPNAVHYASVEDGCSISSGQPNIEEFDNESDAVARAIELGYVFPEDESEENFPS